jgi:hypothetical protein
LDFCVELEAAPPPPKNFCILFARELKRSLTQMRTKARSGPNFDGDKNESEGHFYRNMNKSDVTTAFECQGSQFIQHVAQGRNIQGSYTIEKI